MKRQIKFNKNHNNKLNCEYFTTIRFKTPSKTNYYESQVNEVFDIILNKEFFGKAKLLSVDTERLSDIPEYVMYIDAGMNIVEFNDFMMRMYQNKGTWKGRYSEFIILTFKKENELE